MPAMNYELASKQSGSEFSTQLHNPYMERTEKKSKINAGTRGKAWVSCTSVHHTISLYMAGTS